MFGLLCLTHSLWAAGVTFRYFYDDANELFRVLDSTGTLVEYDYDSAGNIVQVNRSTVAPSSLAILNVTPLSGATGSTITIYGQNFSSSPAGDTVQFGGVAATVVSAAGGALVVQVPAGISNGQITVTVNGVTANSGTLSFTPPPSIASITPAYGYIGQTLSGVVVQGGNLGGATFTLSGGGTVTTVQGGDTQATLDIILGQNLGPSVLIGTNNSGSSSSVAASGDYIIVYNTAGNNVSDLLFSVFNATGTMPYYAPGTNLANLTFSVFNATGSMPYYPPGTNLANLTFSVFNATGTTPYYAPGTNLANLTFSVFNATGTTPRYPAGSNLAWQLFSTQNTNGPTPSSIPISVTRNGAPFGITRTTTEVAPWARPPLRLLAGQSAEISVRPAAFLRNLELDANRAPLATSASGALRLPLTAPFGVSSFNLHAFGYTSSGTMAESLAENVEIAADPGRAISGRVIAADGASVAGAVVTWQAEGLAAEYFAFSQPLSALPDLSGIPARASFVGALNYPNPQQVFGTDPMGVRLGANYAVRLDGALTVPAEGLYQFSLVAHRGARLLIDGHVVAEGSTSGDDAVNAIGSATLTAGTHDIEVTHFESGGAAALQLLWTPPDGVETVVPASAITAGAPAVWRAVTGSDGRFVLHVPAALDGVVVKLATGNASVQVDR
jgi:YD repeat-containing protein